MPESDMLINVNCVIKSEVKVKTTLMNKDHLQSNEKVKSS